MHHSEPCDQEGVNKLLVVNPGVKPSLIQKKLTRGYTYMSVTADGVPVCPAQS